MDTRHSKGQESQGRLPAGVAHSKSQGVFQTKGVGEVLVGGGVQTKPYYGQRHRWYMQLHVQTTASMSMWLEAEAKRGCCFVLAFLGRKEFQVTNMHM